MGFLVSGAAGGAASGAATGAAFGPWGAVAGGVAGGLLGGFMTPSAPDTGLTDFQHEELRNFYRQSMGELGELRGETQPGIDTLVETASQDPSRLRSYQQTGLSDATRSAQARLAAAGMRNAGRGGVLAAQEGIERARQSYEAQNRNEQLAAAGTLAGYNVGATNARVGLRSARGGQIVGERQLKTTGQTMAFNQANSNLQDTYDGLGYLTGALKAQSTPSSGSTLDRFKYWHDPYSNYQGTGGGSSLGPGGTLGGGV